MLRSSLTGLPATLGEAPAGLSSQQWLATVLIALGIALMAILLTVSTRAKIARRNANRPTPRERIAQLKAVHVQRQADNAPLAAHIEEIQERAAMLDNKAERLEQLLAEADERIALLRALNHSAQPPEPARAAADPLARSVYELADSGKSAVEIARELDEQVGKVDLILALRGR